MGLEADLDGRVAIVTGAGQGMGKSVAQVLAARGAALVVNDINAGPAEQTAAELRSSGTKAVAAPGDVTSKADVDRMVAAALDGFGGVHVLVNNAGILRPTHLIDIEEDEWDLVVDANLKSTYLCSRAVLKPMREAGWGRIVNFSSSAGRQYSTLGGPHYSAAKAGILGLTRHLAQGGGRQRHHGQRRLPRPHRHGDGPLHRQRRADPGVRRELPNPTSRGALGGSRTGGLHRVRQGRLHDGRRLRHQRRRPDDVGTQPGVKWPRRGIGVAHTDKLAV